MNLEPRDYRRFVLKIVPMINVKDVRVFFHYLPFESRYIQMYTDGKNSALANIIMANDIQIHDSVDRLNHS